MDPQVTQQVVTAAVSSFTALRTQIMQRESGETVDSLRGVAARAQAELAAAEAALEATQGRSGLVAPEAQLEAGVTRHSETVARLAAARIELRALDSALTRSAGASDAAAAWAALLAPALLSNPTVGELLASLPSWSNAAGSGAAPGTGTRSCGRNGADRILDRSLHSLAGDYASTLRHG
jgi:hypothetical protein